VQAAAAIKKRREGFFGSRGVGGGAFRGNRLWRPAFRVNGLACGPEPQLGAGSLGIEPEKCDVAVLEQVLLAFEAVLSGLSRCGDAPQPGELRERDDLGP